MSRTDTTPPFDHDLDSRAADDLAEAFWGSSGPSWQRRTTGSNPVIGGHDDTTGAVNAIREGVAAFRPKRVELRDATGQVQRTRAHGVSHDQQAPAGRSTATLGQLAAGDFDDLDQPGGANQRDRQRIDEVPLESTAAPVGLAAVDPLLVRLGVLLLVGVLLVPIALALRPSGPDPDTVQIDAPSTPPASGETPPDPSAASVGSPASDSETTSADASSSPAATAAVAADDTANGADASTAQSNAEAAPAGTDTSEATAATEASTGAQAVGDVAQSAETGLNDAASVDASAERIEPSCPQTYTAGAGDSWYRIADAANVSPDEVLGQNKATVDSVILPGDDICLPADADMPSPPTTTAPAADADNADDTATTTSDTNIVTTNAPTTTAAPSTPSTPTGSPGRDASVDEVKALIRSIFPESEWETAYTIVERESRFRPTAYNGWCCYGLFQIYWTVHRSWLDEVGVNSSDDLLDPLLNTQAAYVLWQRAGNSWSPWSTYDG